MLRPEPATPESLATCQSLLKGYPFKPYQHHAGAVDQSALQQLFTSRVAAHLVSESHNAFWVFGSGTAKGLAGWTHLAWDSEQLGVRAGRLDYLLALGDYDRQYHIKEALIERVLKDCVGHGIKHLAARVHASDLSSIHLLERRGFVTLDGILTFSMDVRRESRFSPAGASLSIRTVQREHVEQVKAIARASYVHDRFHSDPRIEKATADELYAVWLENSCLRDAADAVVVAVREGRVLAYVTCKVDPETTKQLGLTIGTIVLVATARDVRGKGVAKAATFGALDWFREQGVHIVEVGTQLRNIPASRLYESCGFRLVTTSLSLRKWNE